MPMDALIFSLEPKALYSSIESILNALGHIHIYQNHIMAQKSSIIGQCYPQNRTFCWWREPSYPYMVRGVLMHLSCTYPPLPCPSP